jgi:hypothetical protein
MGGSAIASWTKRSLDNDETGPWERVVAGGLKQLTTRPRIK